MDDSIKMALNVFKSLPDMNYQKAVDILKRYVTSIIGQSELEYSEFEEGLLNAFAIKDLDDRSDDEQDSIKDAIAELFDSYEAGDLQALVGKYKLK